jgi:DNA adenine methylase
VVYCDPPYIPLSATANFTDYSSGGFSMGDQEDLAQCVAEAARRGALVIISNHDTIRVRQLYQGASFIEQVLVARTISCNGGGRGKAKELIAVFAADSAPAADALSNRFQDLPVPPLLDHAAA